MAIDVTIAGKRFGHLTTAYGRGRGNDIACRCACGRLLHVAAESRVDGTITSCGCQPASPDFWTQHTELRAQQRREIEFNRDAGPWIPGRLSGEENSDGQEEDSQPRSQDRRR